MTTVPNQTDKSGLEMFLWAAPTRRPTFSTEKHPTPLSMKCPTWCQGDGPGHEWDAGANGSWPRHTSPGLRVRIHSGRGYEDTREDSDERGDEYGIRHANIEAALTRSDRNTGRETGIQLTYNAGDGNGGHVQRAIPAMFPDEARELVAVLQHLLRVGQEVDA